MGHIITHFSKADEGFGGLYQLPEIPLSELQNIFGVVQTDPMYASFPIGPSEAKRLRKFFFYDFDFAQYDYFLEYEE